MMSFKSAEVNPKPLPPPVEKPWLIARDKNFWVSQKIVIEQSISRW